MYDKQTIIDMRHDGRTWQEIGEHFGVDREAVRMYARRSEWYDQIKERDPHDREQEFDRKIYHHDSRVTSEIRKKQKERKVFTTEELLELHGFDPKEFTLHQAVSNEWSTPIEGDAFYNYQSKIVARKITKEDKLPERLAEVIQENSIPFETEPFLYDEPIGSLLIPIPDAHFGLNKAHEYADYQEYILTKLEEGFDKVAIVILGDWLHTNDMKHQTIHGTRVNDTDIVEAWDEASKFIEPIIQKALKTSENVSVVYTRGNHDEATAWSYSKYLQARYPQVKFDVSDDQLKCLVLDDVTIYMTHGHIRRRNLAQLCATLYPQEWANAKERILLTGHFHQIKANDLTGVVHYQLPTPSKSTDYEKENLFLGSKKGIHLYELDKDRVRSIHYL